MLTTINISLPKGMVEDAKKYAKKYQYASLSELIREALRMVLYPELFKEKIKHFEEITASEPK